MAAGSRYYGMDTNPINTEENVFVFEDANALRPFLLTIPEGRCAFVTVTKGLLGAKIVCGLMDRRTKV